MKKQVVIVLFTGVLCCSCTHYYYVANVQNVPLLAEKYEFRVSGFFGGGDESNSIEIQTAYAAGDKIGIMADFMSAWGGDASDQDYGRGSYFDGAVGYYKPFRRNCVFEIYGGLGTSTQRHEYEDLYYDSGTGNINSRYGGRSSLSFVKLFIQPSVGIKSPLFEAAVSARLCRLSYFKIESDYIEDDLSNIGDKSHYFIEPALTVRGGWKNFKLQVQIVYSGYLNSSTDNFYESGHLSGGLYFNIPSKKAVNPE